MMTRADLIRFARRDWDAVEAEKTAFWVARKRGMSAADVLAIGDELRRQAIAVRPGWPTEADRAEDHATHARVAEALRAVRVHRAR